MDLISVIIPIYKVEEYLDKCITSIVEQTYQNLEIILVDDGSPDRCPQMCDQWAQKDERIKVIHKENGGLSDARNAGLDVATGDFFAFVDSDDYIELTFLEVLLQTMQQEDADIVGCGVLYVDEKHSILKKKSCSQPMICMSKIEALKQLVLEQEITQTVWNKLYRRSVVKDVLFEVGKCNEDDFWSYQVFDRAAKVVVIQDALYNYLQRESSIMGVGYSLKRKDGLEARFFRMEYLQRYTELADFVKVSMWYDCLYHFQAAIRCLKEDERKIVTTYILERMEELPSVRKHRTIVPYRHRKWFELFKKYPFMIARIRNLVGIGL